jgi:F1F0 ATPase subunit 2
MTPISPQDALIVFAGGGMLGLLFFGGLLLTVEKFIHHEWREIAMVVSFFLRTLLAIGGFYFLMEGQFTRALIALAGFVAARAALMAMVKPKGKAAPEPEAADEAH